MLSKLLPCVMGLMLTVVAATTSNAQEIGPAGDNLYVALSRSRQLSGTPIELKTLKVATGFGDVEIPIEKINGIKFHANPDDSAVIAFKNGDLVTGKISLEKISLKTVWGKAHINIDQIDAVTVSKTAAFFQDTTNGKGWRFSIGTSVSGR